MNPNNCHKIEGPKGFMPSCREVAMILAKDDTASLSLMKRLMFHLHLSMCKVCGPFERQLVFLSKAFRAQWETPVDPEAVQALQRKLKEKHLS